LIYHSVWGVREWVSESVYTRRIINKKSLVHRSLAKQKCL